MLLFFSQCCWNEWGLLEVTAGLVSDFAFLFSQDDVRQRVHLNTFGFYKHGYMRVKMNSLSVSGAPSDSIDSSTVSNCFTLNQLLSHVCASHHIHTPWISVWDSALKPWSVIWWSSCLAAPIKSTLSLHWIYSDFTLHWLDQFYTTIHWLYTTLDFTLDWLDYTRLTKLTLH